MKIIYMHHAERDIGKNHTNPDLRQLEDITDIGIKEAELLAERFKNKNITAIVTSPYIRCKHTAEIINKYHNAPIIDDDRFNEKDKSKQGWYYRGLLECFNEFQSTNEYQEYKLLLEKVFGL